MREAVDESHDRDGPCAHAEEKTTDPAPSVPRARLASPRFYDSAQRAGSANTCSVVPGLDSGVSWPPAAMATISRPLGAV